MKSRVILLAALTVGLSGCWFRRTKAVPIPPPPQPAAAKPEPAPAPKAASPVPPPQAPARPVQPESPPPQLGEVLSDDQRRQYDGDFARSVAQARAALRGTAGRTLTPAQRETVGRIQTFLQQAEESRAKDLVTALQLARRAELLAQDLLKSLQ
ncbi:MAG: hypothetical protein ABSC23_03205 [Bryobacteraceae bacterium]|jgi:type IV secretory pathway VirB10-like protein